MFNGVPFQEGQYFRFPLSPAGLLKFPNVLELQYTLKHLFQQIYGSSSKIKWTMYISQVKPSQVSKHKMQQVENYKEQWKIRCKICTNKIVYGRKYGSDELTLVSMQFEHLHTTNLNKYLQMIRFHTNYRKIVQQFNLFGSSFFRGGTSEDMLLEFMERLPSNVLRRTKYEAMRNQFGIGEVYFNELNRRLQQKYDVSFPHILQIFNQRQYYYKYLPQDLLDTDHSKRTQHLEPQEVQNKMNPNLPNVLLVITPTMKEQFQRYGQWVGFDLTFSVISERTQDNSEYMMGIFASTNNSKKIVIFGLVVTNSQSVFAYKYLFTSFFKIMGSVPEIIITDEEKAMFYALGQLKEEGIFQGTHLFDMFHILRKFRKFNTNRDTFPLIRQLIHAKNKLQYRRIFRKVLTKVTTEKEIDLLRNFDLHSEKYCYSQAISKYVGKGISNNINEFFHSLIKDDMPTETKFLKAIMTVLSLIDRRAEELGDIPVVSFIPYDKVLDIPQINKYKCLSSSKLFEFLLIQLAKTPSLKILSYEQERKRNLNPIEKQQTNFYLKARDHYFVQNPEGDVFFVFQEHQFNARHNYKWSCLCQFQGKAGHLCCHILKVVLHLDQDFLTNISKRWFINSKLIQSYLQSERHLKLRGNIEKKIIQQTIREMITFKKSKENEEESKIQGQDKQNEKKEIREKKNISNSQSIMEESAENSMREQQSENIQQQKEESMVFKFNKIQEKCNSLLARPGGWGQQKKEDKKMTKKQPNAPSFVINKQQKWIFTTSFKKD